MSPRIIIIVQFWLCHWLHSNIFTLYNYYYMTYKSITVIKNKNLFLLNLLNTLNKGTRPNLLIYSSY